MQSVWQNLADQLETRKQEVLQEIRNYPPPIPACDAQFNYLLEQRDQLSVALNRLKGLAAYDAAADELLEFVATSPVINEQSAQAIRLRLEALQK
jgi:hypothetical protein